MSFIKVKDGTKLFYKDWGTGRPVVLVHGWCINCDSWEYVMNELVQHGLRCIAYDMRGCGRSDQPWSGYDYTTLAEDLSTLIESLDLHEVTLIGHSMGGGVITRYLTLQGEARISNAILLGTTTPFLQQAEDNPEGVDKMYLEAAKEAMRQDRAAYVLGLVPAFFGKDNVHKPVSQAMMEWGVGITLQSCFAGSGGVVADQFCKRPAGRNEKN